MNITQLAPIAFEIVTALRDKQCTADDAATCIFLAFGQLTARHGEDHSARAAFARLMQDEQTFRVFELAWKLQRQQQSVIVV